MNGFPVSSQVLGAMITPAVLISAWGVLNLSTSKLVTRTLGLELSRQKLSACSSFLMVPPTNRPKT
jgi:hypothetical protein